MSLFPQWCSSGRHPGAPCRKRPTSARPGRRPPRRAQHVIAMSGATVLAPIPMASTPTSRS